VAEAVGIDFQDYLATRKPYLTKGQIRGLLREGFHIGAHSIDHPPYSAIPLKEQLRQTRESVFQIRKLFEGKEATFAFPFNDDGVSGDFFNEMKDTVALYFGTGGFGYSIPYRLFQRVPMELPLKNPRTSIAINYLFPRSS
jgi:peptidoglycan/xylan/chitin deacetylase (PgdA/CDA1 family)